MTWNQPKRVCMERAEAKLGGLHRRDQFGENDNFQWSGWKPVSDGTVW